MKLGPGPELDAAVQAALAKLCNEPISPDCFSTDWAAAGQVVEQLGVGHIEIYIRENDVVVWLGGPTIQGWHLGVGETVPHAISLAALVAMEKG